MASLETILKAIETRLDTEVNTFNADFEKILNAIEREVELRAVKNISDPLRFDFEFQTILQDVGYYSLVDNFINNSYDKNYEEILESLKVVGLATVFTQEDLDSILATKKIDLDFFRQIGNEAANKLKSDLNKYAISNLTTQELVDNIKVSLKDTSLVKYSTTYANTLISNFNQTIIDLKSKGATGEVYIYVGVKDKKTRQYCACLLKQNKYYNKQDATKIKNDKRRQYNCRHIVIPVSEEYAIKEGYIKGNFTC